MTSRRSLLQQTAAIASAALTSGVAARPVPGAIQATDPFVEILRVPDYAAAYDKNGLIALSRSGDMWSASGIAIRTQPAEAGLPITISTHGVEPWRIHLRWHAKLAGDVLILGDAWERSYGDLEWRSISPDRVMPWYVLLHSAGRLHGFGVKTQPGALCFWQLDQGGISLWLDCSNGGSGVQLGDRELHAATVITRRGSTGEGSIAAAHAFCRLMCDSPRLPKAPLYGSNDWYYCYGKNSADQTLRDAELVASLSDGNEARPFTVIDMGWKEGSKTFPSMQELATRVKSLAVRPGLWIRPLEATAEASQALLLPAARFGSFQERAKERAYDPTIPEALQLALQKFAAPVAWGYELIKHDFSTYDLLGRWGREIRAEPALAGWHFHDRSRTTAEIIVDFYRSVRAATGDSALLVGCNTMGHLGAGFFEAQRTGDDTSGRIWERTRRMGVNTLAFRLPQHASFFALDPDCVGITPAIPWSLNRQWLNLIAATGVALFVSPDPAATGPEQRAALKQAFATVAQNRSAAVPQDWFQTTAPSQWHNPDGTGGRTFVWEDAGGAWPFDV